MRPFPLIAIAIGIVALIALVFPLVQNQRHLREARTELGRTKEQLVQDRAASAQLEQTVSNLKTDLDAANKARTELKENLDDASSDVEQLRNDLDTAQSQLKDREASTPATDDRT